jgi:hypothetical protein
MGVREAEVAKAEWGRAGERLGVVGGGEKFNGVGSRRRTE